MENTKNKAWTLPMSCETLGCLWMIVGLLSYRYNITSLLILAILKSIICHILSIYFAYIAHKQGEQICN